MPVTRLLPLLAVFAVVFVMVASLIAFAAWQSSSLHDFSEVTAIAKPGVNISVVTSKFGEPSERYRMPGGNQEFLYAEGLLTGYTGIEVDPNGIIVSVGYVD